MVLRLEGTLSMIIREGGMDGGEVGRGSNGLEMDVGEEREGQQDSKKEKG